MATAARVTTTRAALRRRPASGAATPVELEVMARDAGLSPELAGRLVRLGVVEAVRPGERPPRFAPEAAERLARAVRLRRDLGLPYSSAALVFDLLARIDELEGRLRRYEPARRPRRTP
jgi:hypothetical protein